MSKKLTKKSQQIFEEIKRTDGNGNDCWSSRDLAKALTYSDYRNFLDVMRKAWIACQNSGINPYDHFGKINEMISIGKSAEREVESWLMSRYACYLSVQNADPTKPIVAQAQTYFAIQTRRAETLLDKNALSEEDEKRLVLRKEMTKHNTHLASAAKEAGVVTNKDYGIFQNFGYRGLYGGLDAQDIHDRKGLTNNQRILDHMGSTELAANLFRATQTEEKLRREGIKGKNAANKTHEDVGRKVRQTIAELGGTMPEDLPVAESIKKLAVRQERLLKQKDKEDEKD